MATSLIAKIVILTIVATVAGAMPQGGRYYPLRLQPELDSINVDDYLKNEKLVDLQIQCVIYDGPCDAVGRWIKPRVAASFLGQCPLCTQTQQANVQRIIKHFQERRPEAYNVAVVKFLREAGVDLNGIAKALVTVNGSSDSPAAAPAPVLPLALNAATASIAPLTLNETAEAVPTSSTTAAPEVVTTTTEATVAPPPATP